MLRVFPHADKIFGGFMQDQKAAVPPGVAKGGALLALVGAATAAIVAPFVSTWESGGKPPLRAYRDMVGVWTICDGDTKNVVPGMTETAAGCAVRLDQRLADHVGPVLACAPVLAGHPYQLSAAISLAYNVGTGAFCRSTIARLFKARQWRAACDGFPAWSYAGGRQVQGLLNRRRAERALCLKELPPA
ncbi:lysozyme [Sphingomonas morindae]|uniref:Lysozyme n=1 Tax=Sphingomonas morindae TaxID=1541170 RepID=A0ABY4X3Z3_9SPHN|nr:lysozyme [Sphingomonas morindae]USI71604.1 lysozyme [Sphingomonas morindae]